ncbi:regulator of G-protein signaling 21-like [Osmerus eperlanus]|uniref:regulator of G-protein signaling 21-like n=1 Tax=Osmerus eperlanus TaxID=29151 RepID=UPI002E118C65
MNIYCEKESENSTETRRKHKPWKSRIHNFIHSPSPRKKIHRQSLHYFHEFGESLEKLISHKCGQAAFHVFLKSEFCDENLEFWLACEELKSITNPEDLTYRAIAIYEEFIRKDAPKEINLDFYTRDTIAQNLQLPAAVCFVEAQRKVYSLMENDVYPRFLQSDCYRDLCVAASGALGLGNHSRA